MKIKQSRREFIKTSAIAVAAAGFPFIVPATVFGKNGNTPPSDRIVMGMIGVGSMGGGHVRSFLGYDDVQIAGICDVRQEHRDRACDLVNEKYGNQDCKTYNDFKEIIARDDIDAYLIAVPDHWHALIGIEAARHGKHVYYEKPLSMSINESKTVRDAMKKYNVVFQFGTQQRSDDRFRQACELVRNHKLGDLQTIMIASASFTPIPNQPVQPVPKGFDYERWLGPAPHAPYTFERCTRSWTLIKDYSLGCLSGAWGIHHVDIAQWANNSDNTTPVQVEGWGIAPDEGLYDTYQHFEVEHTYKNGVKLIHMDTQTSKKKSPIFDLHWEGLLFQGSEEWVFVCREFIESSNKSLLKYKFTSSETRLPICMDHRRNFLDSVKKMSVPMSPIDNAVHSDIICHQADIAIRLGRKLDWDPDKEEFINDADATKLMSRPMRAPWHL